MRDSCELSEVDTMWTGHPEGMLDRDLRTAKISTFDRRELVRVDGAGFSDGIAHCVPGRPALSSRKNGHFWKSLHRLKHALIVGAYLSLVTFPSILSAPTIRKSMSRRDTEAKWRNPCGLLPNFNAALSADHAGMSDVQLLDAIVNQAKIAKQREKHFPQEFAQKTFNMDLKFLHQSLLDQDYDWLPTKDIAKKYLEPVPDEHLQTLEFQPTLLNVHGYLQRIAVGVEQMVWDEEDRNGPFKRPFVQIEAHLNNLLCEIHTAIIEKNLTIEKHVERDIMGKEFRNMDNNTSVNIRNWIIYRDYLNMLEYVVQVFSYFKTNLPLVG